MTRSRDLRQAVAVGLGLGLVLSMLALPPAIAGPVCTYVADPPNAAFRGTDITVTGSFSDHANGQIGIGFFPENPQPGQFLPIVKLGDNGTTNNAGNFDETRTIPGDMDPGTYRLAVYKVSPGFLFSEPPGCYEEYTVLIFFVVFPVTTTTAAPTTTTTTTVAPTTTSLEETTTTVEETTTSVEETTTSVEETTTTEDLLAGDEVDGGGFPWLVLLIVLLVGAVLGLVGYIVGLRRPGQVASAADEPPPPAADGPLPPVAG